MRTTLITLSLFAVDLFAVGCGGARHVTSKTPAWFDACPKAAEALYFCADASDAATEAMARELAVHKALGQLTLYVGATVKSDERISDVEKNGVSEQEVSATVDVAGEELVIKEARVKKVEVQPAGSGFAAYAMIEWPRTQYEALLAAQRARAQRALAVYLEAEQAALAAELAVAQDKLREARNLLGPAKNVIPLEHGQIKDSSVLLTSMQALEQRIGAAQKERGSVCAVGLLCLKDGAATGCRASRIGVLREAVARSGKKVASEALPDSLLAAILQTGAPKVDAKVKSSGCIVAVQLTADLLEAGKPFTFVKVGARASVFDTATNRIVETQELEPTKVGHLSFDGAMQKGFDELEKKLADTIGNALSKTH